MAREKIAAFFLNSLAHGTLKLEDDTKDPQPAEEVLVHLVDAIAERFGRHAVLTLVEPIKSEGGKVGVNNVHSRTSISQTWLKDFDYIGFTEAVSSFFPNSFANPEDGSQSTSSNGEQNSSTSSTSSTSSSSTSSSSTSSSSTSSSSTSSSSTSSSSTSSSSTSSTSTSSQGNTNGGPFSNANNAPGASTGAGHSQSPSNAASSAICTLRDSIDQSGWSPGVKAAFKFFTATKDWGPGWARCVEAWVALEKVRKLPGFKSMSKLPISSRPPEVGTWMKHGRPWTEMPISGQFPDQCKAWWQEVQPPHRLPFDLLEDITDWGSLNTGGSCGVMLILMVLNWWRYSVGVERGWEELVIDVAWVLEQMRDCALVPRCKVSKALQRRASGEASRKRSAGGDTYVISKRPKRS